MKNVLERMKADLAEMEAEARKLENQNFADVLKSAHGKIAQAADHPDADKKPEGEQLPFGGKEE